MKKALLYLCVVSLFTLYTQVTEAQNPTINNLSLDATPSGNSTNDDLEANYNTGPGVVETATTWYRNGSPLALLYLPFEGGPSNALLDFSGNDNHVTTTGNPASTPVWSMTGGYNGAGAFEFDGNDYLLAGDILPLNSSYTKTAWVYDTGSGYRNIISSTLQINNNHSFNLHPDNTLHAGHSFGNAIVSDLDPLNQNEWYFVAVTFDYETGEMALFKDAVQVDREIVPDSLRSIVDPGVMIGAKNYLYGWKGTIDEPRIYDHVLTTEQLRTMFVSGIDDILALETRAEDQWQVHVTPFSSTEVGTTVESNIVTLEPMSISSPTLTAATPDNLTLDDLSVSYTSSASVVETATAWLRNGIPDALLYFPFEGGPANALLDFSGNDNHLSRPFDAIRVPRWDDNGGHDGTGAFYYNGNDWLEVVDVFPLNSSYTKSAWVNASSFGYNNIMSSRLHGDNNHFFKIDPDGILGAGHSFGNDIVSDPSPLVDHQWYFVALTFDFATGEMTLYKNGAVVDQAIVPEGLRSVIDATVQIGSMQTVYGWEGNLDDARLHDRVLTAEQIQALYATGKNIMVSEETAGGEEWQAVVTPFSVSEIGDQLSSNILTVNSVIVTDIPGQSIVEGSSFTSFDLDDYVTSYDFTSDELVWTSSGSTDLIVAIDQVTHVVTITTPDVDWFGSENITFTATDPNEGADFSEVTFAVTNVNDAPEIAVTPAQSTPEDTNLTGLAVTFSDPDPDDTHTIDVVSSDPNVTVDNLSGNVSGSTYNLVPAENWYGTAQITVTVTDDGTGTLFDTNEFNLEVSPVNDEPVLTDIGDQDVDEDGSLAGLSVVFNDVDAGDLHTITVVSDNSSVTVVGPDTNTSGSLYSLVPAANWNGSAQITVTVTDDGTEALSGVEIYTLTVNPVNDAPDSILLSNDMVVERVPLGTTVGKLSTMDVDLTDTHTYTFVLDGGTYDVDNDAFTIVGDTLKTNAEFDFEVKSSYSVFVQSDDGNGGTKSQNFSITIGDLDETSVEDIYNNASFNIYPVPAIDYVNVEVDNPDNRELLLEIYSNTGRLVHSEVIFSKSRINLTGFTDGMYFLRVSGEQIMGTRKLIIKDR